MKLLDTKAIRIAVEAIKALTWRDAPSPAALRALQGEMRDDLEVETKLLALCDRVEALERALSRALDDTEYEADDGHSSDCIMAAMPEKQLCDCWRAEAESALEGE